MRERVARRGIQPSSHSTKQTHPSHIVHDDISHPYTCSKYLLSSFASSTFSHTQQTPVYFSTKIFLMTGLRRFILPASHHNNTTTQLPPSRPTMITTIGILALASMLLLLLLLAAVSPTAAGREQTPIAATCADYGPADQTCANGVVVTRAAFPDCKFAPCAPVQCATAAPGGMPFAGCGSAGLVADYESRECPVAGCRYDDCCAPAAGSCAAAGVSCPRATAVCTTAVCDSAAAALVAGRGVPATPLVVIDSVCMRGRRVHGNRMLRARAVVRRLCLSGRAITGRTAAAHGLCGGAL
jgi:hypothetical protein